MKVNLNKGEEVSPVIGGVMAKMSDANLHLSPEKKGLNLGGLLLMMKKPE